MTRRTPTELVLKSQVRTRFSLLKPDLSKDVEAQQMKQKLFHDRTCVDERQFVLHQYVAVRNNRVGPAKWLAGRNIKVKGPRTYIVCVCGANRFVHVDHLMATSVTDETLRRHRDNSAERNHSADRNNSAGRRHSAEHDYSALCDYSDECDYSAVCDKPSERDV